MITSKNISVEAESGNRYVFLPKSHMILSEEGLKKSSSARIAAFYERRLNICFNERGLLMDKCSSAAINNILF